MSVESRDGILIDDVSITPRVKYALLTHRSTSAVKTTVTTKEGIVVVTGEAASDAEKALVTKLTGGSRREIRKQYHDREELRPCRLSQAPCTRAG